ncbi:MAG: lamin tail domain-containing protein [bacterium]|nr:lamin tail domain-containing protein [bacterium]
MLLFRSHAWWAVAAVWLVLSIPPSAGQGTVLFDASHRENAGNADWIVDADLFDANQEHYPCGPSNFEDESRAQRFPTPPASGIDASTDESYWTGAISAFGVDLVQIGFGVESLPEGAEISFGNPSNPQDLQNYSVFVLPEPNRPFSPSEASAILDFVAAGGGLFLIADHQTSDRDCDGHDSPHILNDLMGVVITGGQITDFGLFGVVFNVEEISAMTSADYWFTDAVNDNVAADPSDPILHGPHGDGTGGLGLFGSTAMTIDPAANPSVTAHVWKTDVPSGGTTRVTFATAAYGSGRIACIGDSSPADDGSGDTGDTLYLGWDQASGGVANREIHLNAVEWLAGDDTTAPTITTVPSVTAADCSASITWETDEPADSAVAFGPSAAYGSSELDPVPTVSHDVTLIGLVPESLYHYSVTSTDSAGNSSLPTADATFVTSPAAPPTITSGPHVVDIGATTATVAWTTSEPADARVDFGSTPSYGGVETVAGPAVEHEVLLTGLSPETQYHYEASSYDECGNGPVQSGDLMFDTLPPELDVSGWSVLQFDSSQSFVFPPGTAVPGGGYLVLGRDASRAAFEAEWGALPPGTVYVDSEGVFPFINGGESFRLEDELGAIVDGTTIAMSSGQSMQRIAPDAPAGDPASWLVLASSAGTPGGGAGAGAGVGVVINEAGDAAAFANEFLELYYDAIPPGPDDVPPGTVDDLFAEPLSDVAIRLTWTATGDDAESGIAAAYDVRVAAAPITDEAAFLAASPLAGAPAPQAAGSPEAWDVSGLVPNSTYYFALQVVDEVGNRSQVSVTAGATTGVTGGGGGTPTDHLVVSELRTRGTLDQNDEFIELHNPTAAPIDLDGLSVQYKSAGGSTFLRVDLPDTSIPAHGFFLLARPEYSGGPTPDATWTQFLMGGSGGHVFVVDSTANLTSCIDASIVDRVGYGTGDCPETAAAPAPPAGETIERLPGAQEPLCGNGTDSNDNSADFSVLAAPDPQNAVGPPEPPCLDLGNVGDSLYVDAAGTLRWAAALHAVDYKVRRAAAADFMTTHPIPDDTYLLDRPTATSLQDPVAPSQGELFYYFVTATDGATGESLD